MRVYVVTEFYCNDGECEDYSQGLNYHCVCSTFNRAVEAIENIIRTEKDKHEKLYLDDYDIFESHMLLGDNQICEHLNNGDQIYTVAKMTYDDYASYTWNSTFYITETELR